MTSPRESVARAMAFFAASDDIALLRRAARDIAPRAARMVGSLLAEGDDEAVPPPASLHPARQAAGREEALRTLRTTDDFALLQALARAIGRRIEALEIVASAEFPEGARVLVPAGGSSEPRLAGTVQSTGTELTVILDNGETWAGPPSSARREGRS